MLVQFHFPKCLKYLFLNSFFFTLRLIIRDHLLNYKDDPIMRLFTTFFGEMVCFFIYLCYKKIVLNTRKNSANLKIITFKEGNNKNENKNYCLTKLKKAIVPISIFFTALLDFFGVYNYNSCFSYEMKKLTIIYENINMIFLRFFISLSENYFLNIQNYVHHKIGLTLMIIPAFIIIWMNIYVILDINIISFLLVIIISLESQAAESFLYSFEKKLNYEYFVSIYYICFLEGLFGMIILAIYLIIFKFIFNIYKLYEITTNEQIIYIIGDIISTLCFNAFRLKISEITKPSYNIIANFLANCFFNIYCILIQKETNIKEMIISTFFCSLGTMIFCEVMTLNFCDLDKNTNKKTIIRAILDSNQSSELFSE